MYGNTTLGTLIEFLEKLPKDKRVKYGFGSPHSDRGSYDELAFDPKENVLISDMLENSKSAVNCTTLSYSSIFNDRDNS